MTLVTATQAANPGLPFGRPLTVDDLPDLPDDGHRYELLDGTLLVSPAPGFAHQSTLLRLAVQLVDSCPGHLQVMMAPFAVQFSPSTELQPDVLVAPLSAFTLKNLPVAPLLAVEIKAPSTATIDRTLKRAAYAALGVPNYWLVDPDPDEPALAVLRLEGAEYVGVHTVRGDDELLLDEPFAVRLRPSDLVVRLPEV